jgi:hypothetical protein
MIGAKPYWPTGLEALVPAGYRPAEPKVETGCGVGRVRQALGEKVGPVFLWRIGLRHGASALRRPLQVRVYAEGSFVFAENETLAVCGTGETSEDAVEDLASHVAHFHAYYKALPPSKVTGEAERLKKAYSEIFDEE